MLEKKLPPLVLKIVLIGDTQVGKTAILNRKINKKFTAQPSLTESMDFLSRETRHKNTLLLWDSIGRESQISGNANFGETDAFVFVVDSRKLLTDGIPSHIKTQLENAKKKSPDAIFYIAVNKCDLGIGENGRITEKAAADQITDTLKKSDLSKDSVDALLKTRVFFCSAKKNKNIDQLFSQIEKDIINDFKQNPSRIRETHLQKSFTRKQPPLRSYVWRGGNILLALGSAALSVLSAFTVGSFLTFGFLPFAFIGAFIMIAAAFMVWNIGCKIYDAYSEKDKTSPPPPKKNKPKLPRFKAKNKKPFPSTLGPEWVKIDTKKKPLKPAPGLEPIEILPLPSVGTIVVHSSSEEDTLEPSITISQPNSDDDKPPITNPELSSTSVFSPRERVGSAPIPLKNKDENLEQKSSLSLPATPRQ